LKAFQKVKKLSRLLLEPCPGAGSIEDFIQGFVPLFFLSVLGDPDLQDPHVFGASRILPFSHKRVERTEIMLARYNFNTKILAKNYIFKTEDNVPAIKFLRKN
jgi:hypothetical protein